MPAHRHWDRIRRVCYLSLAITLASPTLLLALDKIPSPPPKVQQKQTVRGLPFVMIGEPGAKPKPLIVSLAMSGAETLQTDPYCASGRQLAGKGWLAVSLDIPGHGAEARPGEPPGIEAWRVRIEKNEAFVDELAKRVSAVLDTLIAEKAVDPNRIAIEGTSRGGFLAGHVAAREPRFKAVIMYAPVTDLQYIREFHLVKNHPGSKALSLVNYADRLADRKLWVIIGNDDTRVDTDSAIRFTREVCKAAKQRKLPPSVVLHVPDTPGHASDATMHHAAALWLIKQLP